jgi:hypothetical protein
VCHLCHNVLNHPVTLACHHLFCSSCIAPRIKTDRKCPVCSEPATEALTDSKIEGLVAELAVRCPNTSAGCESKLLFGARGARLEEHMHDCPHAPLRCLMCERMISRSLMTKHMMDPLHIPLLFDRLVKAEEALTRVPEAMTRVPEALTRVPELNVAIITPGIPNYSRCFSLPISMSVQLQFDAVEFVIRLMHTINTAHLHAFLAMHGA